MFAPLSLQLTAGQPIVQSQYVSANTGGDTLDGQVGWFDLGKRSALIIANFAYYIVFEVTQRIARGFAYIFDSFTAMSINSPQYTNANAFIIRGWELVRDFTNILFIFGLLYIAAVTIFSSVSNVSTRDTKKFLVTLVIAALLVNFSLFLTRVIVDVTNIAARVFYNNIEATTNEQGNYSEEVTPISAALLDKFDPQNLIDHPAVVNVNSTFWQNIPRYITSIAAMTFIHIVLIGIFFSMALLFLGRMIALWIYMIISPAAVALMALPPKLRKKLNLNDLAFSAWIGEFIRQAIVAPFFLFFLYLIVLFLDITDLNTNQAFDLTAVPSDNSYIISIAKILLPFLVVIYLLRFARDKSKELSSSIANSVVDMSKKAIGVAAGVGLGVAAGGLKVIGGGASRGLTSLSGKAVARGERIGGIGGEALKSFGRVGRNVGNRGQNISWDVRNLKNSKIPGVGQISSAIGNEIGIDAGKGHSSTFKTYQKGFGDFITREAKADAEDVKKYTMSKEQRQKRVREDQIQKAEKYAMDEVRKTPAGQTAIKAEKDAYRALEEADAKVKGILESGATKESDEYITARDAVNTAYNTHKTAKKAVSDMQKAVVINDSSILGKKLDDDSTIPSMTLRDLEEDKKEEITSLDEKITNATQQSLENIGTRLKHTSETEYLVKNVVRAVGVLGTFGGGGLLLGAAGYAAGGKLGEMGGRALGKKIPGRVSESYSKPRREAGDALLKEASKVGAKKKITAPKPTGGGTPPPTPPTP